MPIGERLNLREVAEALELDRIRLYRLGRYYRLAPGDPCVPGAVVERAKTEVDEETRYRRILEWLRTDQREERSGSCPTDR